MKLAFKILQRIVIGLLVIPSLILTVVVMILSLTVGVTLAVPVMVALSVPDWLDKYMDFVLECLFPISWLDAWAKRVNR